jgi:hypothetical protein
VVGRVPVAGADDDVEAARVDQLVDARRDRVAVWYGEGAAAREVVLEVDDQEGPRDVPIIGA